MMWDECGRHEAEIPFERLRTSARVCARDVCNAFFDSFGSCTRDWHDNHSTHKAELPATFVSAQSYLVGLKREVIESGTISHIHINAPTRMSSSISFY